MYKIYYANVNDLDNDQLFKEKLMQVRIGRQLKVEHCKKKEDQLRSLAGGLLIKYALEQEFLPYDTMSFDTNSHGKILVNNDIYPVWISLSHSGDFAAVIISNNKVGIDIQQERDVKSKERMMEMCYTEKEKSQDQSFFYYWTRKEAYSKMMGLGLSMDFKEIDATDPMTYYTRKIEGDYWLSIASNKLIEDVDIQMISLK